MPCKEAWFELDFKWLNAGTLGPREPCNSVVCRGDVVLGLLRSSLCEVLKRFVGHANLTFVPIQGLRDSPNGRLSFCGDLGKKVIDDMSNIVKL